MRRIMNDFATFELKNRGKGLLIGANTSTKVNCNIGINHPSYLKAETHKLCSIFENNQCPDMFMDLSTIQLDRPLYKTIITSSQCPVGTVPTYLLPMNQRISQEDALDLLKKQADDGISFFTLHFTASLDLLKLACKYRKIPVTSRGGGMLLHNMQIYKDGNIWKRLLPQIIDLAQRYDIAISLGSTFRPAGIVDACDEVHIKETQKQIELCKLLQQENVKVIIENIGHIDIQKIKEHSNLLKQFNAPIMPLGPLPIDSAFGLDSLAAAIGASCLGVFNCCHIVNCITAAEHKDSFPSISDTLEAIRYAKLAAHIIDVAKGIGVDIDNEVYNERANKHCCIIDGISICERCNSYCPLKLIKR